jgi:catechol 2,3-dioxygenase-like lactoylglutathione lyase family enzyme
MDDCDGVPPIGDLDHVGIVVSDLDAACSLLALLGFAESGRIDRPGLRAVFLGHGRTTLEIIEVTDEDARERRLGGRVAVIEHLAFVVEELDRALETLARHGLAAAGPPRTSRGTRTVFIDPATTRGIALQLVERRRR